MSAVVGKGVHLTIPFLRCVKSAGKGRIDLDRGSDQDNSLREVMREFEKLGRDNSDMKWTLWVVACDDESDEDDDEEIELF